MSDQLADVRLNAGEREVLDHLAAAWNGFLALEHKHPSDRPEFQRAIHAAQAVIATRVAQRVDPNVWR